MSNPGSAPTTQIPSVTGNTSIDALIRYALIAASTALTAYIVGWLNREGFTDPNLSVVIGAAILGMLGTLATVLWGLAVTKLTRHATVQSNATSAATGVVPDAVKKLADTPALKAQIDAAESVATDRLNAAQLNAAQLKGPTP